MYVCLCIVCIPDAHEGQKRALFKVFLATAALALPSSTEYGPLWPFEEASLLCLWLSPPVLPYCQAPTSPAQKWL